MNLAIYSTSPLVPSGYGNLIRGLVYHLLSEHECTIYAYYGLQNTEITVPLNGRNGIRYVRVVGNTQTKTMYHPVLVEDAGMYDLVIGHLDQWLLGMVNNIAKQIPENVIWWLIVDSEPLAFPTRKILRLKNSRLAIPATEWGENVLRSCRDIPQEKIYSYIPYGIDPDEWKPVRNPQIPNIPEDAEFVVVTIAPNVGLRECVPLMIEGFAKFLVETRADAYYYIHSSPYPESIGGYNLIEVCRACEELYNVNLRDRIVFKKTARRLPIEFMRNIYSRADVLLNPVSGNVELPIMEAACCGTPSIGLNFAGTGELLSNDRGILVRGFPMWMNLLSAKQYFPYPQDICDALKVYYREPECRRRHTRNLRKWIERNATWDIVGEKWLKLLREIER